MKHDFATAEINSISEGERYEEKKETNAHEKMDETNGIQSPSLSHECSGNMKSKRRALTCEFLLSLYHGIRRPRQDTSSSNPSNRFNEYDEGPRPLVHDAG